MKSNTDFIEIGKGTESKVIGHNNTISELGATALSIVSYAGKGGLVVFFIMALWLYFAGYSFYWSVGIAATLSISLTITAVYGLVTLTLHLQRIVTPLQPRDDNGRYVARDTPVSGGGRYLGRFVYDENNDSAYLPAEIDQNGTIEQWGRGVD